MQRYEEDGIDALGQFMLLGAVAFLGVCVMVFIAWCGWL